MGHCGRNVKILVLLKLLTYNVFVNGNKKIELEFILTVSNKCFYLDSVILF